MSLNVLVTAGSRRVPLVQAFQRALRTTGGGEVIVTDVNPLSPTIYIADRAHRVPLSSDPSYIDVIEEICVQEHIGLIVPTIDDELDAFAAAKGRFSNDGILVAVSPLETTRICNDKYLTSRFMLERGLPVVETYTPADLPADPAFPLFIKPRNGRGGVAAFAIHSHRDLEFFLDYVPDPVIQPYLDGPEFTIDVLCDFNGELLSVVPRERVVIRAGVVDRGRTVRHPKLMDVGIACARGLGFVGAVNIQCRVVKGQPIVFEINPRFSGGIPLTIAAGADFPRMLVQLARGARVVPSVGRFQDNLWMTSYETSVFVADGAVGFTPAAMLGHIAEVA